MLADVISFAKTSAEHGGLSNMASQYPLFINEVLIPSKRVSISSLQVPTFPSKIN